MKKITLITLWACIVGLCSCTYDYEMPDTSNTEIPPYFTGKSYLYNVRYDSEFSSLILETINDLGYIYSEAPIVITEKDEEGSILRQFSIDNPLSDDVNRLIESAKRAETIEISIELYGWTDRYLEKLKIGTIEFAKKYSLKEIEGQVVTLGVNDSYKINIELERYFYGIAIDSSIRQLMEASAESIGYDLYDFKINVIEKDSNGNVLYEGEKPNFQNELGISHDGAQTVEVYIDMYGYHRENYPFEDEIEIGKLTFNELFNLNDIQNQLLTLTTNNLYTIDLIAELEQRYTYSISLDSSTTNAINDQLLNPANCRFGHYEIIVTEKDADGNVLYQGEYEIHTTRQSEKGAKTLEAAIDVYGYDKDTYPFGEEKKIGSIIFTEIFNLAEIENPFILSAYEYAHRWERYY